MRFVTDEKTKKEYKKFLEGHERCNFQQSLEWAEVKKPNWKPEVVLAEDEEDLQASHVLTAVGVPTDICAGSITMSLSKYIEEEDIDHVLKVSPEIIDKLCAMSPAFDPSKIKK